jgi:hypothetical protein
MNGTWSRLGQANPLVMSRGEYRPRGLELSQEAIDRLAGSWVGRVQNPAGAALAIVFRFESTEAGNVVAFLDSPDQGANGIPMSELQLEGDQLSLVVPAAQASFRATLSADGMEGTWAQGNQSQPVTMARGVYTPAVAALDLDDAAWERLAGTWRGPMDDLEIVVRFETNAEGTRLAFLDIPARGAAGLAITAASLAGDALELSVPAGGLTIAGTLSGGTLTAEWRQGATNNPLTLTRQP